MTEFLTLEDVLDHIQRAGLVVKDPGLLDSALMRPRTSLFGSDAYPSIGEKAAAMMHSLAQNQPLLDGNKRTGLLCTHVFLRLNGYRLGASEDKLFALMLDMAEGLQDIAEIAQRLKVVEG